jgi:allophanate hydrolase
VNEGGGAIEVEVWELTHEAFGRFVANIPPPLGIWTLTLENCETAQGFLCESAATSGAKDITGLGSWRNHLSSTR